MKHFVKSMVINCLSLKGAPFSNPKSKFLAASSPGHSSILGNS